LTSLFARGPWTNTSLVNASASMHEGANTEALKGDNDAVRLTPSTTAVTERPRHRRSLK
jgi:hypothetical protein